MSKQTKASETVVSTITIVKPASGREANPLIMEGTFSLDGFSVPKLGIHVEGKPSFVKNMFLLGLCKILGDNVANEKDKLAAIQDTFQAWNHGFPTFAAWEKSKRQVVVSGSGKSGKFQYSQLQIASALRATLGADDSRAKLVESLRDELFALFLEKNAGESYMVDAFSFLKKQDDLEAEKEKAKLEAELAALGL